MRALVFAFVSVPGSAALGDAGSSTGPATELSWHPCPYERDKRSVVRCGQLRLTGSAPTTLPIVVIQVYPLDPTESAVLFLQGGPGGASGLAPEQFAWPHWVRGAGLPQDLVVFDQRGTGLGDPSLTCPEYDPLVRPGLIEGWFSEPAINRFVDATASCHARLSAEGHDLQQFTTLRNAEDVVALMEALPYSEWTLLGASYGTRLALEVIRMHPDGLRAVVLDGVLPPDVEMQLEQPALLDRAIDQIGTACIGLAMYEPDCIGSADKFHRRLSLILDRFAATPHWVEVGHLANEDTYKLRVGPTVLLDALHTAMTLQEGAGMAREAVMDAALEKYELLDWILEVWAYQQIDKGVHDPVFLSVICDLEGESTADDWSRRFSDSRYYQAYPARDVFREICAYWTASRLPAAYRQPISSSIPTLLFSGEYDPLTPASWGDRVASGLENGHHFVVPRGGHVSVFQNFCAMEMVTAFLADPNAKPDSQCLQDTFIDLLPPP